MTLQEKAEQTYQLLIDWFGEPRWVAPTELHSAVIDELIHTMLSANTNDVNSKRAFEQLKTQLGSDWDNVRLAPLDVIKAAIRPAGMYNQKAPNIVATLEQIRRARGDYDLSFLADIPLDDAMQYLIALPGVGHKTASIVMLFCFNHGAFPVDTHIQRISQRLGIGSRRASPEKLKQQWEELLPPANYYGLHVTLIQLGRTICQARTPECHRCPLQPLCDYANGSGGWQDEPGANSG